MYFFYLHQLHPIRMFTWCPFIWNKRKIISTNGLGRCIRTLDIHKLLTCFYPSEFLDFVSTLTNLSYTCTLYDYVIFFKKIAYRTLDLLDAFFKIYFISGFQENINIELQLLEPVTWIQVIDLAKLAEGGCNLQQKPYQPSQPYQ